MPTRSRASAPALARRSPRVLLRPPAAADEKPFLAAVAASRALHAGWVRPPATRPAFREYLRRYGHAKEGVLAARDIGFVVVDRESGELAGTLNLSEIVRGALQGAFLGYYGFAEMTGRGLMREGLRLALDSAFGPLRLHRIEANIQPVNHRSIALVEAVGFVQEGFSPRYLKVAGRWRDHLRYAMLADRWGRPAKER